MNKPSAGRPDEATRRAARWLAFVAALGMVPMIAAEIVFLPSGTREVAVPLTLLAGCAVLVALWTLHAGGPWLALVAPVVAVLDLGAVLCGALLPVGLDIAVILPLLSAVLLVAVLDGWRLRLGLTAGWLSGVVAAGLARSSPGLASIPHVAPVPLAIVFVAAGTGLGYIALSWAATHWHAVAHEAQAAAEQARLAEIAQKRSAERFRALVEHSPLPTLTFDVEGRIRTWNPAAERYLGWAADEVLGRPISTLVPERLRAEVEARARATVETARVAGPRMATFQIKDGGEARAEVHDAIDWDADGNPAGVVVQFVDVTEREAIAERLVEAQRLEAVGQLAGGVAHDFNNSLTAIAGFASLIASGESPDPREDAGTILGAAEHAAILTRQLLAFSRRVPLQPRTLDLRDFLATAEPLVRSLIGETIVLRRETDSRPALVEVDAATLEQAILNLATNARDAMPQGGELTLAVRFYPACVGGPSEEPVDHVAVAVSDTGAGIPPSIITRVFEPFFTTKPFGKGSGLGLPMVHGFVALSGGHVVVSSPPGQGTTLELHFPRTDARVPKAEARAQPIGGTESVLFVEDDPGVASFGLACLRRLGYDVTPAMNGTEAEALAVSRPAPFDLLLTDVVIPGMSGSELATLIHRHHPGTAILYASGYSAEHVDSLVVGPQAPLLEKPYSLEQLAAKVRAALDARPKRAG
ncbi:MAG: PAS domain S-box protein [Candidatus Limnocylindrales bacterium]|jgi:PAS domain S-box-containing protein